jgi:hypothetical protein
LAIVLDGSHQRASAGRWIDAGGQNHGDSPEQAIEADSRRRASYCTTIKVSSLYAESFKKW